MHPQVQTVHGQLMYQLERTPLKELAVVFDHAGIESTIANHSSRATSATQMYRNGVHDKVM